MSRIKDLAGQRFGRLVAISHAGFNSRGATWKCLCDCGKEKIVLGVELSRNHVKSCGCLGGERNLIGQRFGKLTVIALTDKKKCGQKVWECLCDCGTRKFMQMSVFAPSSNIVSCGCHKRESAKKRRTTHGQSKTKTYKVWQKIKDRCCNPNDKGYPGYGGRGIKICDRWLNSYENFLTDMGERPEGMSIDRVNNEGNYEPSNCRWATRLEQNNNTRKNRKYEYQGKCLSVAQWSRELGIHPETLRHRLNNLGMTFEEAVRIPIGGCRDFV